MSRSSGAIVRCYRLHGTASTYAGAKIAHDRLGRPLPLPPGLTPMQWGDLLDRCESQWEEDVVCPDCGDLLDYGFPSDKCIGVGCPYTRPHTIIGDS
jgi:hypothetical protein